MDKNNIHNPFIGLRTYEEADAVLFRGRKSSTLELYDLILENDVVVLHAESGEGKSSLLNAGLFPMLRDERFFPIKINFTDEDYALESPDFDKIVYHRIIDSINQINNDKADTSVFKESSSLNGKVSIVPGKGVDPELSQNDKLRECTWWLLRNFTLNAYGATLIPVLVFDQFEEVFTKPKSNTWTEDFFVWLSTTLNDTVPQNVIALIREIIGEDAEFPKINTDKKFKALFSLRTEYMGELDYWGIQRHHIAILKNSRYSLKPLTERETDEVLELQPIFTTKIREQIKQAIRSSNGSKRIQDDLPTIPAMLLSVVCTTATDNIVKNGSAFNNQTGISNNNSKSDLFANIIYQFYKKEITEANVPENVIKQIENTLVDDKGKRVRTKTDSIDLRKVDFENKYKPILEQRRLIKCTQINGEEYVELVHDQLAAIIQPIRNQRFENQKTKSIATSIFFYYIVAAYFIWHILPTILHASWALLPDSSMLDYIFNILPEIPVLSDGNIAISYIQYLLLSQIYSNIYLICLISFNMPRMVCDYFYSTVNIKKSIAIISSIIISAILGTNWIFGICIKYDSLFIPIIGWITLYIIFIILNITKKRNEKI